MRRIVLCTAVFAALFLVARSSSAQVAIAGVVKDSSGAVMPGVTVEASSPALIEKVRTSCRSNCNFSIFRLRVFVRQKRRSRVGLG